MSLSQPFLRKGIVVVFQRRKISLFAVLSFTDSWKIWGFCLNGEQQNTSFSGTLSARSDAETFHFNNLTQHSQTSIDGPWPTDDPQIPWYVLWQQAITWFSVLISGYQLPVKRKYKFIYQLIILTSKVIHCLSHLKGNTPLCRQKRFAQLTPNWKRGIATTLQLYTCQHALHHEDISEFPHSK